MTIGVCHMTIGICHMTIGICHMTICDKGVVMYEEDVTRRNATHFQYHATDQTNCNSAFIWFSSNN